MNTVDKGKITEDTVAEYLIKQGYTVVARNFRCVGGEIDIIAFKDSVICAVEVKKMPVYWNSEDIEYKISPKKINSIKKTFSIFLARNCEKKYDNIRFDVAVVTDGNINYYEGVF